MKRFLTAISLALAALVAIAPSASAAFGVNEFSLSFENADGSPSTQAGAHPFSVTNILQFNSHTDSSSGEVLPDGAVRDISVKLPEGLVGRPTATPQCSAADFINVAPSTKIPNCSNGTAVGVVLLKVLLNPGAPPTYISEPVYNLVPPPGFIQKLGFNALEVPVTIEFALTKEAPYRVEARLTNISQVLPIYRSKLIIWGNPASPAHDFERGSCINGLGGSTEEVMTTGNRCEAGVAEQPFVTQPVNCNPLTTSYLMRDWQGETASGESATAALTGCERLGLAAGIAADPTSHAAESPSGLDFALNVENGGLVSPGGLAGADIARTEVSLPEGFTTNPSVADGLATCTETDLARETAESEAGAGCPNASKIGTVEVETPLLEERLEGSLFVATPYENSASNSLLGLYMVIKNRNLGVSIVQPLRVEPNAVTGRLTAIAENLPQLPFSHFKLHFREGPRAPLSSPPRCGEFAATAVLTPSTGAAPVTTKSLFSIVSGPNGGPCPSEATAPFRPGFEAGTTSNAAGRYSPFFIHLTRNDGEQAVTRFSVKLPPGVIGKLAGVSFCPDAAIAAAAARTGPHGGQEEISSPSCPATSEVGHVLVGAGVGPSLAYAPGKLYLAGPYHGSQLSLVSITAAKVGPFDLGTVVVRFALRIDPETAEVFVDGAESDPIPYIIKGIPVHLRDVRGYVDRPSFVLNPTSCRRTSTISSVFGSGASLTSAADDLPVTVSSPFQAAGCRGLGFKPKLVLSLDGGTKRGANPALKAVVTPRKGDANIGAARVTLPHSEFLENAHIKTICTRVQFNAGGGNGEQCPKASVYGRAKAVSPILDEPLSGPVYLRSSNHELPDLVAALHSGRINIDLDGRIDSAKGGRIRNVFEIVPDAPVTKFTLELFGGKKSLLVNSTDICQGTHRVTSLFTGQNGRQYASSPLLIAQCGAQQKGSSKKQGQS